ncbi:MAG: DUF1365 domain-containing protein [Bacteriovorax sp.]|nr:DUF1365 domain-containing protein [Bacteriovorax sp.]
MKSLFKAKIYHKRFLPSVNEFNYSGFYIKFSLDHIHELKSAIFGVNKFNLFSFYEKDHGYKNGTSLDRWARDMLEKAGVSNFNGQIFLQTFPRVLGYVFNPVSFCFCYEKDILVAVIAEVNNTFGESHNYVLTQKPGMQVETLKKEFHVSPFYDVLGQYHFDFTTKNKVTIDYFFDQKLQLVTSLIGQEIPWSDKNWLKLFFQYPFYTIFIVLLIHYQALRLFIKKNKFYPKPKKISRELTYEHNE